MASGRWRAPAWTRCWASGPTSSSTSWPTGSGTPTAGPTTGRRFLPERRVMMQAWADYLDRLRAGEEIEATHGTGAFRNTNVAGDPGTPTHGPPFPVAGAVPPTVGPVPSSPPRVLRGSADTPAGRSANWVIRRLAAALKTLPGGISGRERPPPGRVAGACTCQPSPMPYQASRRGGRSHLRPRAPERRRRSGGRAATVRQPATSGSAGAHMELTFRCTCTPMSDVHSPISTELRRSALTTTLREALAQAGPGRARVQSANGSSL